MAVPRRALAATAQTLFVDQSLAAQYARSRPTYPPCVFDAVVSAYAGCVAAGRPPPASATAVDVATGSGQFAGGLAARFGRVLGLDVSPAQIEEGRRAGGLVEYSEGAAESTGLPDASADVLTAAEAMHWFDIPAFYAEAHRVLAPHGLLAVVGYGEARIEGNPAAQAAYEAMWRGTLGPFWHARRQLVDALYAGHEPAEGAQFVRVTRHDGLRMERSWRVADAVGYSRSWSAYAAYLAAHGVERGAVGDPAVALEAALTRATEGGEAVLHVAWPVVVITAQRGGA